VPGDSKPKTKKNTTRARRVGVAELRGNLATYLRAAKAGQPILIQERGRSAYVLTRFEEEPLPSVFGCMRDRTDYVAGAVVNAGEEWPSGRMP